MSIVPAPSSTSAARGGRALELASLRPLMRKIEEDSAGVTGVGNASSARPLLDAIGEHGRRPGRAGRKSFGEL
jgi:hypothetical protein